MAIIVYSNGIVEELVSLDHVFTEEELLNIYKEYHTLHSERLEDISNTWVLWGEMDDPPENEYNKIAEEILDQDVFSHITLIHDSEIDPKWRITDDILYKSYPNFVNQIRHFLEEVSGDIIRRNEQELTPKEQASMIFLSTLGHTKDKRVLFSFNPEEQSDTFYSDGTFDKFAVKIFDFLNLNFYDEPKTPFVIFADTKTVVLVEDPQVDNLLDRLIDVYRRKEKYETCSRIKEIKNKWKNLVQVLIPPKEEKEEKPNPTKKITRRKSKSADDDSEEK